MKFADGIEKYVTSKRAQGVEFSHGKSDLTRLARITGDIELSEIKQHHILAFLNQSSLSNVTWRMKYYLLLRFFDFWTAYGVMPQLVMPPIKPKLRRDDNLPYIYTRPELKTIMRAANDPRFKCSIHPQTMRTFLIILYGIGARMGEVLPLRVGDVNLSKGTVTINNKNPNRCRTVPIGSDLVDILRKFFAWRSKMGFESPHLFVQKKGKPIIQQTIGRKFLRLLEIANVTRNRVATGRPRMMDLQTTFAVHRIDSWIYAKKDLNRLLPALALYMGFGGLGITQRYLYLAPARFKQHLNKLSSPGLKRHWRNDKSLMRFLDNL